MRLRQALFGPPLGGQLKGCFGSKRLQYALAPGRNEQCRTVYYRLSRPREACGWDEPPRYLIRDRDGASGAAFIRRIGAMGIRDRPVSARSPWQNGYVDRLIGSIRQDVLITSSSLASAIFATCLHRTKYTTAAGDDAARVRSGRSHVESA
jgi:hypothetical protein